MKVEFRSSRQLPDHGLNVDASTTFVQLAYLIAFKWKVDLRAIRFEVVGANATYTHESDDAVSNATAKAGQVTIEVNHGTAPLTGTPQIVGLNPNSPDGKEPMLLRPSSVHCICCLVETGTVTALTPEVVTPGGESAPGCMEMLCGHTICGDCAKKCFEPQNGVVRCKICWSETAGSRAFNLNERVALGWLIKGDFNAFAAVPAAPSKSHALAQYLSSRPSDTSVGAFCQVDGHHSLPCKTYCLQTNTFVCPMCVSNDPHTHNAHSECMELHVNWRDSKVATRMKEIFRPMINALREPNAQGKSPCDEINEFFKSLETDFLEVTASRNKLLREFNDAHNEKLKQTKDSPEEQAKWKEACRNEHDVIAFHLHREYVRILMVFEKLFDQARECRDFLASTMMKLNVAIESCSLSMEPFDDLKEPKTFTINSCRFKPLELKKRDDGFFQVIDGRFFVRDIPTTVLTRSLKLTIPAFEPIVL